MSKLSDAASDYLERLESIKIVRDSLKMEESMLANCEARLFQAIEGELPTELAISYQDRVTIIHLDLEDGTVAGVTNPQLVWLDGEEGLKAA